MKYLLIITTILLSKFCYSQQFYNRTLGTTTPNDPFLSSSRAFYMPRSLDTTLNGGLDSIGALTYDRIRRKIWIRDSVLLGGHKWTQIFKQDDTATTLATRYDLIQLSSTVLNNIGSGFRLAATPSGNIKTIFGSNTITVDSSSNSNALTFKADTSVLATQYDLTQTSLLTYKNIGFGGIDGRLSLGEVAFQYDSITNTLTVDTITNKRLQIGLSGSFAIDTIYVFGDSYSTAVGATTAALGYAQLLAQHLQLALRNFGVSGSTLEKRTPVDPYGTVNMIDRLNTIPIKNARSKYILFAYGLNDVGYNGANYTAPNFSADYRTVIDTVLARGWSATDIILVSPWYIGSAGYSAYASLTGTPLTNATRHLQFVDTTKAIAQYYGTKFFDIYRSESVSGSDQLQNYDAIHAGNAGHAFIAEQIAAYVNYTVLKNGQAAGINGITEVQKLRISIPDTSVDTYTERILSLDTTGIVRTQKSNSIIRNNLGTQPDPNRIFINGKILVQIPGSTITTTDVESIITNTGVKGGYLRANGSLPSGLVGSAVEIAMVGAHGYVGAFNRTAGSGLNLLLNSFGNVIMGTLTPSGSNIVQITGNTSINSGKLRIGSHSSPTVTLEVSSTDAVLMPLGTTAQRPAGAAGYLRTNSDSTNLPEYYDGTNWQALASRNWVRSNFATGNTLYTGDGTLAGNRTVNANNLNLTFNDVQTFRINYDTYIQSKADGTFPYTNTIVAPAQQLWIGYTPTAGTFSKGSAIVIDTNNNVALGTSTPPTTAPLYADGAAYVHGFQSGRGNFYRVSDFSADHTMTNTEYWANIDASGGNVTITLPAASTVFGSSMGIQYVFKRTDASGNTVTVQRNATPGTDLIDGAASFTIVGQYTVKEVQCTSTSTFGIK